MRSDTISDLQVRDSLRPYQFSPTSNQSEKIRAYISLLLRWNQRISLTTVVDPTEILQFHFGESLFAASVAAIRNGRLADVGSGAGFPGLALALGAPELAVSVIESNTKKAAFLAEVVRMLDLRHVEVINKRMEEAPPALGQLDFITARALGAHKTLMRWARQRLASNGSLVLWLGEEDSRKIAFDRAWTWRSPLLVPGSKRRFVLVGCPNS